VGLDFRKDLTKAQYAAVTHDRSLPAMVASTVGSGKTRCITYRIAYLLSQGVDPHEILAITFTNKAATEMKERVASMVRRSVAKRVWISTFHSMCARMLRSNSDAFGVARNYSIADADDSKSYVIEATMAVTGLEKKVLMADRDQYGPGVIQSKISKYKNELIRVEDINPDLLEGDYEKTVVKIYEKYERLLKRSKSLDFDDLLLRVAVGLRDDKTLREGYSEVFCQVLVDEYQDTNRAQYEILRLLTSQRKNPYVVGDDDQCIPGSEEVTTSNGPKQIRYIREGDEVLSGAGCGTQRIGKVEKVFKRFYEGEVIRVTTQSGYSFRATPEHAVFGRTTSTYECEYVYLMYKEDLGFRIGRCSHYRSDGNGGGVAGFIQRLPIWDPNYVLPFVG
jgi:DNA helicase-2/ATP-dependent DNA helicase PcrA